MAKDQDNGGKPPAEVINLRRARKARQRADAAATAAENRARFGRPLAEKRLEVARESLETRRHEGLRLLRPVPPKDSDEDDQR